MQTPNVKHVDQDNERNITFEVYAYRNLSRQELMQLVSVYASNSKTKLKAGTVHKIMTHIGANGR